MLRLFVGMILGSLTTLMLLGGQTAANQMFENMHNLVEHSTSSGLSLVWLGLLVLAGLGLSGVAARWTKAMSAVASAANDVRRPLEKSR